MHPSILSVAFDIIDPGIFLDWDGGLGVGGTVLILLLSELISGQWHWRGSLNCGVPWGSVLSSLLYNTYMKPVDEIIDYRGIRYHQYSGTQSYLSAPG